MKAFEKPLCDTYVDELSATLQTINENKISIIINPQTPLALLVKLFLSRLKYSGIIALLRVVFPVSFQCRFALMQHVAGIMRNAYSVVYV